MTICDSHRGRLVRCWAMVVGALLCAVSGGAPASEPGLPGSGHWAFRVVRRPAIPEPSRGDWSGNPIDAFIASGHEVKGLKPAPAASRRTLLRRLTLDLHGLPPTPEQIDAFLKDTSPHAYGRLVDRLLDSPHYGERWARHWLDVARWAESEGYESNHPRPFAWRYRDYVIDSFNSDRPYNEFIRQQLAGDELEPYSDENVIATGFLAAARISSNEEDKWLQRNDTNVDIVNATGAAFLGLTLNCAQCHDHKFDPISMRDYYRLQGYFVKGQPVGVALRDARLRREYESRLPTEYEPAVKLKEAIFEAARRRMISEQRQGLSEAELQAFDTPSNRRSVEQELLARKVSLRFQKTPKGIEKYIPEADRKLYEELKKKIEELEKTTPPVPQTFAYYSPVTSPHDLEVLPSIGFYPLPFEPAEFAVAQPYVKLRGDVHGIGPKVDAGWPSVFDTVFEPEMGQARHGSRRELAAWLTDRRHPLTARVWVNRLWYYHFGRGLVAAPGDFGLAGEPPTHPALLDWLAAELIESGWSTKHIQRLIVGSNTYRQSSQYDDRCAAIDPENAYLWHWQPRRLENEVLRDAMLAASGELDRSVGGPSVPIEDRERSVRRSIYLFQKRGVAPEMQKLFDGPTEASESCARRNTSTTALQSLYLLNNGFVLTQAEKLAQRLHERVGDDRRKQIATAFLWTLSREPEEDEVQAAERFLDEKENGGAGSGVSGTPSGLALFCQVLLNLNEFAYME